MFNPNLPKVLVPVAGKPMILHLLRQVKKIKPDPVIVLGYKASMVKKILGGSDKSPKFAYQKSLLGTAHAVLCAKPKIQAENILVLYGDMPLVSSGSMLKILRQHQKSGLKFSMFTSFVPSFLGKYQTFNSFGRIIRNSRKVAEIKESKDASAAQLGIREINPGIYVFNSNWLWQAIKHLKNNNSQREYYLTDLVAEARRQKLQIGAIKLPLKELWGINTRDDLLAVESLLRKR